MEQFVDGSSLQITAESFLMQIVHGISSLRLANKKSIGNVPEFIIKALIEEDMDEGMGRSRLEACVIPSLKQHYMDNLTEFEMTKNFVDALFGYIADTTQIIVKTRLEIFLGAGLVRTKQMIDQAVPKDSSEKVFLRFGMWDINIPHDPNHVGVLTNIIPVWVKPIGDFTEWAGLADIVEVLLHEGLQDIPNSESWVTRAMLTTIALSEEVRCDESSHSMLTLCIGKEVNEFWTSEKWTCHGMLCWLFPTNFSIIKNNWTIHTFANDYIDMYHPREYPIPTLCSYIPVTVLAPTIIPQSEDSVDASKIPDL